MYEPEGVEDTKETMSFGHRRADPHMNSETGSMPRGLPRFKPDGIPALRGESGHRFPPLTKVTSAHKGKLVFSNMVSLVLLTTVKGGRGACPAVDGQHRVFL